MSNSLWPPHGLWHTKLPCPSPTPGVYSNSCPLSPWCHPTISSSVVPFCSCPQSFPASGSLLVSQFFTSGSQSTGVWALASVLPKKSQGWSLSEWTGWISLQSKGLSRVFSNTTVQKHQFFGTQLSSQSNSDSQSLGKCKWNPQCDTNPEWLKLKRWKTITYRWSCRTTRMLTHWWRGVNWNAYFEDLFSHID